MNMMDRVKFLFGRKSLYDLHPELTERVPILRVSSDDRSGEGTNFSYKLDAGYYTSHMWVRKAIDVLANNLSPLPVRIVTGSGQDKKYLEDHPIYELLDNPNPDQGGPDLWREWVITLMLGGEVGFEAVYGQSGAKVIELWPREPSLYSVIPQSLRYRSVKGFKVDDGVSDPYMLSNKQFIQFKFHNPLQPFRGISPINAIRLSIVIDQLAQVWTRLFFRNQARPDFAMIVPEGMTRSERTELENQISAKFSTNEGVHKPIILENGVTDIKPFSWAPKDMEWVNQREFSRDEIGAVFGVPDEIMGYGKDTYENFGEAENVLWMLTIIPLAGLRDGTLTRFFRKIGMLKAGEKAETDLRDVPQLQEDRKTKIETAERLWKMGTPLNVLNEYLHLGMPKIEGGDVGYIDFGKMEVGSERNNNSNTDGIQNAPDGSENDDSITNDSAAPSRSAAGGRELGVSSASANASAEEISSKKSFLTFGSPEHEVIWKRLQGRINKPVDDMQVDVKKEFQRQQNEVGKKLRDSKSFGRGLYKALAPNEVPSPASASPGGDMKGAGMVGDDFPQPMPREIKADNRIPPVSELFDLEYEVSVWSKKFKKPISNTLLMIAGEEMARLGAGDFDMTNPNVVSAIKLILDTVSRKTNETTWSDLTQLMQEAEAAGESIPAIQERLSEYFGNRKSDWETERIARTTMNNAANKGDLEAWKQSGLVTGKIWIAALDDRTREAHYEAHGQVVNLGEFFDVGGERLEEPGDGSPENSINCRCNMLPVTVDE